MIAIRNLGQIDPNVIRRAAARAWPKHRQGANRTPDHVVAEMVADYQRTKSTTITARNFNRAPSTIRDLFYLRGIPLRARGGPYRKAKRDVVATRYAEYRRCGSLAEAAQRFGVTGEALGRMFHYHGLPVNPQGRNTHSRVRKMKEAA